MGLVLTTLLEGMERAHPLLDASTFCGACTDVCPVKVPLTTLFRRLREQRAEMGFTSLTETQTMAAFGIATQSPALFSLGQKLSRVLWPIFTKIAGSSRVDRLPRPAATPFRRKMSP
jgi:L-lactate dehydrogenase complex protein LldF